MPVFDHSLHLSTEVIGWIEVICGGMSCGKSEELIRRIKRARIARMPIQVFKPALDTRWSQREVVSRNGTSQDAVVVERAKDILNKVERTTCVVAVDEAQFFDDELVNVCQTLANRGIRVIVAGLDQDFRGEPFGPIPKLMAIAEVVDKLRAICVICGNQASRTQRIVNGRPASYNDPLILVGARENYEARCRRCHKVSNDPHDFNITDQVAAGANLN